MIDVKDLRIGNYLCYKGNADIWFEVDELHSLDGGLLYAAGSDVMRRAYGKNIDLYKNWFRAKEFAGIPITPEWLEKLGLEKDDHCDYCRWLTSNYQVVVETSPPGTSVCILDEHSDYAFVRDIEYVHQLQNLIYNLTGQELTIGGGE